MSRKPIKMNEFMKDIFDFQNKIKQKEAFRNKQIKQQEKEYFRCPCKFRVYTPEELQKIIDDARTDGDYDCVETMTEKLYELQGKSK